MNTRKRYMTTEHQHLKFEVCSEHTHFCPGRTFGLSLLILVWSIYHHAIYFNHAQPH